MRILDATVQPLIVRPQSQPRVVAQSPRMLEHASRTSTRTKKLCAKFLGSHRQAD